jgi:hypothetical protein
VKQTLPPSRTWFRWIALLPAAFGGALLCCLVAKGAFDRFDDLFGFAVSDFFVPVAFTAALIELAVAIAPKFKFEVCVTFTVLNAMLITVWALHAEFSAWYVAYVCIASIATSVALCVKRKNESYSPSDAEAGLTGNGPKAN